MTSARICLAAFFIVLSTASCISAATLSDKNEELEEIKLEKEDPRDHKELDRAESDSNAELIKLLRRLHDLEYDLVNKAYSPAEKAKEEKSKPVDKVEELEKETDVEEARKLLDEDKSAKVESRNTGYSGVHNGDTGNIQASNKAAKVLAPEETDVNEKVHAEEKETKTESEEENKEQVETIDKVGIDQAEAEIKEVLEETKLEKSDDKVENKLSNEAKEEVKTDDIFEVEKETEDKANVENKDKHNKEQESINYLEELNEAAKEVHLKRKDRGDSWFERELEEIMRMWKSIMDRFEMNRNFDAWNDWLIKELDTVLAELEDLRKSAQVDGASINFWINRKLELAERMVQSLKTLATVVHMFLSDESGQGGQGSSTTTTKRPNAVKVAKEDIAEIEEEKSDKTEISSNSIAAKVKRLVTFKKSLPQLKMLLKSVRSVLDKK